MDIQKILSMTDLTLLNVGCTREDVEKICEDAVEYGCATAVVPPYFVPYAKECVAGRKGVGICTAIGFPNGYNTPRIKAAEAEEAVKNGADEIDVIINVSFVKDKDWDGLKEELHLVREACRGVPLKVIIETCLLTDEEKEQVCRIVSESGAEYIKTSTGFSTGGATVYDVEFLKKHVEDHVKVKASGGIRTLEDAQAMIDAGASRLGSSGLVKAAQEQGYLME